MITTEALSFTEFKKLILCHRINMVRRQIHEIQIISFDWNNVMYVNWM